MIIWLTFVIINCFQGGSKPWKHSPKVNVSGPGRREKIFGQDDEPPEPLHFLDILQEPLLQNTGNFWLPNSQSHTVRWTDPYIDTRFARIRLSGDLNATPGIIIVGPKGTVKAERGLMVAQRHIHMTMEDADALGYRTARLSAYALTGKEAGPMTGWR